MYVYDSKIKPEHFQNNEQILMWNRDTHVLDQYDNFYNDVEFRNIIINFYN